MPHKNVANINGKPLISYSIDTALAAKSKGLIQKVIVSTDSQDYASISIRAGAEVPFLRPAHISLDTTKSIDVIQHALDWYASRKEYFDAVMLLQPTNPLRNFDDISESIDLFRRHPEADSLISAFEDEYLTEFVMYKLDKNGVGTGVTNMHNKVLGGRKLAHDTFENGCIYLTKVDYIRTERQIISDNPLIYVMPLSRSNNIDTQADLEQLRTLI